MSSWSLYLIRCGDDSLYTGIALDVDRRFSEHEGGAGAKYLRGRGPLELLWSTEVGERGLALKLERRVKRLPRERKEALVNGEVQWGALFPDLRPEPPAGS